MDKTKFSQEQIDKNKLFKEHLDRRLIEKEEKFQRSKTEAPLIGKEFFDLSELKKYWSFRYQTKLTPVQIDRAMKDIERDYYLAGKQFLTMKVYGEFLMKMELYR
jgi:hypothetical protein